MKRALLFFCFAFFFALPLLAAAQNGLVPCSGPDCQACNLVQLLNNVIRFLILSIAVPILGVLVAYAGFLYFSSAARPDNIERAKSVFAAALIGFIIMLAGWLIVDTIFKTLAGSSNINGYGPWNSIQCVLQPKVHAPQPQAGGVKPVEKDTVRESVCVGEWRNGECTKWERIAAGDPDPRDVPESATLSDSQARQLLAGESRVEVASFRTDSLAGIRKATVDQAIAIARACNCKVLITGAVGQNHAAGIYSHQTGYKIDLAPSFNLDLLITQNKDFTRIADRPGADGGPQYVDKCGNRYVREYQGVAGKDHWDIVVYRPCSL